MYAVAFYFMFCQFIKLKISLNVYFDKLTGNGFYVLSTPFEKTMGIELDAYGVKMYKYTQ